MYRGDSNPRVRRTASAISVAVLAALMTEGVMAQAAPGLDEIVVTAERRTTNLQDTPIAITAVSQDDIIKLGVEDTRELAKFVPNLTVVPNFAYGNSQPKISIRGIGGGGLPNFGIASDPSVAIYIDGMYFGRNPGSILSLSEIRQVEVLRGPQGTLFGRNTTGGAIVYKTYNASTDAFEGYVSLDIGSYNKRNLKAGVNIPLSDTWAVRIAAADLSRDGEFTRGDKTYGGVNSSVGHVAFHGEPTDRIALDAKLSYTTSDTNGEAQSFVAYTIDDGGAVGRQVRALSVALQAQGKPAIVENDPRLLTTNNELPNYCLLDDADPFTLSPKCDTWRKFDMTVATFNGTFDLNDHVSLKAFTGVLQGHSDNATDFIHTGTEQRRFWQDFRSFQQEFLISTTYDRWKSVAGIIHYTEDATEQEITKSADIRPAPFYSFASEKARVLSGQPLVRRHEYYGQHTTSSGLFGQATYSATRKLDVTFGLRYTYDKKEGWIHYVPSPPTDLKGPALVVGQRSWTSTDWRLALQYHFNDNVMLYLSGTKGYQSGVMNDGSVEATIDSGHPTLGWTKPEDVVSKELGLRSEWFDHRLRVNVTYFDMIWGNRTGTDVVQDALNNPHFISINQPNIRSKGYEMMTTWAATDSLTIIASYSTNEARQEDNPDFVLAGNAEENWSLRLRHNWNLSNGGMLTSSLNYAHTGSVATFNVEEDARDDPNITPGYGFTTGRITYTPDNANWEVSLYAQNLLDEDITYGQWSLGFFYGGAGTAPVQEYQALPRTFGAHFRYNF